MTSLKYLLKVYLTYKTNQLTKYFYLQTYKSNLKDISSNAALQSERYKTFETDCANMMEINGNRIYVRRQAYTFYFVFRGRL